MIPPTWFTEIQQFRFVVELIMKIPLTMTLAEGEVYGTFQDLKSPKLQKSMTRKLKTFQKITPFTGEPDWREGSRIGYSYYEHSSRRKAYRKRMILKAKFPYHRRMLLSARQISQKQFLSTTQATGDITRALKRNGFKNLKHLWQVCNNPKLEIPEPQKSLTHFIG